MRTLYVYGTANRCSITKIINILLIDDATALLLDYFIKIIRERCTVIPRRRDIHHDDINIKVIERLDAVDRTRPPPIRLRGWICNKG